MVDTSLIVPTDLINGALHFAEVLSNSTVQDVIDALVAMDNVKRDILGDLEDYGWALQLIRREHAGRRWEEHELNCLGNGWFM